jgi:hypothetical protein
LIAASPPEYLAFVAHHPIQNPKKQLPTFCFFCWMEKEETQKIPEDIPQLLSFSELPQQNQTSQIFPGWQVPITSIFQEFSPLSLPNTNTDLFLIEQNSIPNLLALK